MGLGGRSPVPFQGVLCSKYAWRRRYVSCEGVVLYASELSSCSRPGKVELHASTAPGRGERFCLDPERFTPLLATGSRGGYREPQHDTRRAEGDHDKIHRRGLGEAGANEREFLDMPCKSLTMIAGWKAAPVVGVFFSLKTHACFVCLPVCQEELSLLRERERARRVCLIAYNFPLRDAFSFIIKAFLALLDHNTHPDTVLGANGFSVTTTFDAPSQLRSARTVTSRRTAPSSVARHRMQVELEKTRRDCDNTKQIYSLRTSVEKLKPMVDRFLQLDEDVKESLQTLKNGRGVAQSAIDEALARVLTTYLVDRGQGNESNTAPASDLAAAQLNIDGAPLGAGTTAAPIPAAASPSIAAGASAPVAAAPAPAVIAPAPAATEPAPAATEPQPLLPPDFAADSLSANIAAPGARGS